MGAIFAIWFEKYRNFKYWFDRIVFFLFLFFNNLYVILLLFFLGVFDYFLEYVQSLVPHISGYYKEKFLKGSSKILAKDFELKIS